MSESGPTPARSYYQGFSLVPPNDPGWVVISNTRVEFALRKDGADRDESYVVHGRVMKLPEFPTRDAFFTAASKPPPVLSTSGRFRYLSYSTRSAPEKGEMCVRNSSVAEDHNPARPSSRTDLMILEVYSLVCAHLQRPTAGIMVIYSQRYYPGNRDPRLEMSADKLFATVTFTDF